MLYDVMLILAIATGLLCGIAALLVWGIKEVREALPDIWPFLGPVGLAWWIWAGMPDGRDD